MNRKPPIKNYNEKMDWMINNQKCRCSGCGDKIKRKSQFAHYLPRTDDNLKKYSLMIDSILNASMQCSECNIGHITQYGKEPMTDIEAQTIETYLQNNPEVERFVNNPNNRDFNLNEIVKEIFGGY